MSSSIKESTLVVLNTKKIKPKRIRTNRVPAPIPQSTSRLLKDRFPEIYAQIDRDNNPGVNFEKLTYGMDKVLNWICPDAKCDHHKYEMQIKAKTMSNPQRCPFCTGKRTCPCQSFAVLFPDILRRLDIDKFKGDPYSIPPGSSIVLPWICNNPEVKCDHHRFERQVRKMIKSSCCTYCDHTLTCICESFARLHPHLLEEIDWEQIRDNNPEAISPGSLKILPWICQTCKFKWEMSVWRRTHDRGCPACHHSTLEKACLDGLRVLDMKFEPQKTFEECRHIKLLRFDYHLPELNALIELDGLQHFQYVKFFDKMSLDYETRKIRDNIKNTFCETKGIHLLRISWSERKDMLAHLTNFITLIRNSTTRIQQFIGVEYTTHMI